MFAYAYEDKLEQYLISRIIGDAKYIFNADGEGRYHCVLGLFDAWWVHISLQVALQTTGVQMVYVFIQRYRYTGPDKVRRLEFHEDLLMTDDDKMWKCLKQPGNGRKIALALSQHARSSQKSPMHRLHAVIPI